MDYVCIAEEHTFLYNLTEYGTNISTVCNQIKKDLKKNWKMYLYTFRKKTVSSLLL